MYDFHEDPNGQLYGLYYVEGIDPDEDEECGIIKFPLENGFGDRIIRSYECGYIDLESMHEGYRFVSHLWQSIQHGGQIQFSENLTQFEPSF